MKKRNQIKKNNHIEDVNDRDTYAYNYKNVKAHDAAPVFAVDAGAQAHKNENGDWAVSFDEAQVPKNYIVHDYTVSIRNSDGIILYRETLVNNFYIHDGNYK